MKTELLLDNPDLTHGFYRYVIFNNGEKKYLQLRLEEISTDENGVETSKIENAIRDYAKSIGATSCKFFHVEPLNSEPREMEEIIL